MYRPAVIAAAVRELARPPSSAEITRQNDQPGRRRRWPAELLALMDGTPSRLPVWTGAARLAYFNSVLDIKDGAQSLVALM